MKNMRGFTTAVVMRKAKGGKVKGVHEKVDAPHLKGGMSKAGLDVRVSNDTKGHPVSDESMHDAKDKHKKVLSDMKSMPAPKIKGLAEGGRVSVSPIKRPKMVPSDAFSARLRDEEDDLMMSEHTNNGPQHQPPEHDNELEAQEEGPDVEALHMKRMAEGGHVKRSHIKGVHEADIGHKRGPSYAGQLVRDGKQPHANRAVKEEHEEALKQLREMPNPKLKGLAEGGDVEMDVGATASSPASRLDRGYGKVIMKAMGGEISPDDEIQDEDDSSIAAAIMSKRKRMADGGEVDLSQNADEEPNHEDQMSFEALKKENYSESEGLDALAQPEDSNLHHVALDSDEHDMISAIRRKMKQRR